MKNILLIVGFVLIFFSASVVAHPQHGLLDLSTSFTQGFLHPVLGLDHLLAFFLFGLLTLGLNITLRVSVLALTFSFLAIGFVSGHSGWHAIHTGVFESVILFSMAISAVFVLIKVSMKYFFRRMHRALNTLIVAIMPVFFYFHGVAHGVEIPAGSSTFGFFSGFMIAAILITACSVSLAAYFQLFGNKKPIVT
jgi:urease accessory protein